MTTTLRTLNDRISCSKTHPALPIFLPVVQKYCKDIWDVIELGSRLASLSVRSETTLNVIDFDDTMYGRYVQLQQNILQDNRWEAWNRVLRDVIWFHNFIEQFYCRNNAVRRILWVAESRTSRHFPLILTAWIKELQEMKIDALDISRSKIPLQVVSSAKEKPRKTLDYIVGKLQFIPGKIIIYEDRSECFLREDVLAALRQLLPQTEIVVDKVFLNPPGRLRQIDRIEQQVFLPSK